MTSASDSPADLPGLLMDTVREAARSWRLPASLALGVGFGFIERSHTGEQAGLVFGVVAAMYTLFLGPLPWRVLVPLEEDGRRLHKLVRWGIAGAIALGLFAMMVLPYAWLVHALDGHRSYLVSRPRELAVSTLLFLVGGWGLARDVQLEQRLDRTIRTSGRLTQALEAAQLSALRADLDPHFLFNALNAIASQCTTDPVGAEDNIVRLSSLLRAVLDTRRRALHPLDEELALARDYLALLATRYPELKFRIEDHDESLHECMIPPLILQPLLENAVRHGQHAEGPVVISVTRAGDGRLCLIVSSAGALGDARDGGIGLELVRRRLAIAYQSDCDFLIETHEGRAVATLNIPLRSDAPRPAENPS
ncbi:MAG: histidine kinase [Deltaproteobacteria bacterium]|nr:histidine kinase [Deltaproteobacteria bacterium]